ncbi:MAG: hypothetical protein OXG44_15290 [Gammaproteobacteria bacterium]|nr:hypothetical protein [Gammaproteobacteria bacterium]
MKRPPRLLSAVLALGVFVAEALQADYLAHAVGVGAKLPLPESIAEIDAEYLLELQWSYRAGLSTIVVPAVEDLSSPRRSGGSASTSLATPPVAAIRGIVEDVLRRTGRFSPTEPVAVASNAPVAAASSAQTDSGGYVLKIAVADYRVGAAPRVANPRALNVRRQGTAEGHIALTVRLLDASGQVVVADRFEATVRTPRPTFEGLPGIAGLTADAWSTAVAQAMVAAVHKAAYRIVKAVGPLRATGRVVKAEDERVWINLGTGAVAVGDVLDVARDGEKLIDPETGLDLGGLDTSLGSVRVTQVEDRFSIAAILDGTSTPSRGDRVTSASPPPPFEFAPTWDPPEREVF